MPRRGRDSAGAKQRGQAPDEGGERGGEADEILAAGEEGGDLAGLGAGKRQSSGRQDEVEAKDQDAEGDAGQAADAGEGHGGPSTFDLLYYYSI
jgi:hypothetical protein